MKGIIFLCTSLLALGVCLSASFGLLSDEKRMPNQNMFGGYGEIYSTGNYTQHFYYDDTNFYYRAYVPTWNRSFFELYSYDFETGESYPICRRISCSHKTADCSISPCYQGDIYGGNLNIIDNKFISLKNTDDELKVRLWYPLDNTYKSAIEIPRYNSVSDAQGLGGKYESFFNDALRLNDNMLLIGYNNEMHIYDNNYKEMFRFSCRGLLYPLIVGNKFCWSGMQNELNSIDLESGAVENNLLDGLFETKEIVSIREFDYPFSAFVYGDEIYFPRENRIYAFNPASHSLHEVMEIDTLSKSDPYACFGDENLMYYKKNGIVHTLNLDTLTVTDLPDLPKVPCASVHDFLLFVSPETTGTNDIECYYRNGKQVHT